MTIKKFFSISIAALGLITLSNSAFADYTTGVNNKAMPVTHKHPCKQNSPFSPYELNYILPFYYTQMPTPYDEILPGQPNQKIETKFQISVQAALVHNIMHKPISLSFFYTQSSFWQFYAKSAYFRETNYNPGLFFHLEPVNKHLPFKLQSIDLGFMHESNGRGANNERSWNRAYFIFNFLPTSHFLISIRPWYRVQHILESKDYNPDITKYMGYGDIRFIYFNKDYRISLMLRNVLESHFKRGGEELNVSFPLFHHLHGFAQLFSGYGQSLISYNHYTNGLGVGISLFNANSRIA